MTPLVGGRWTLPVVRELLYGPRRFGELRRDVRGISGNVLSERLRTLGLEGVVGRRRLPSPANVDVYELTAWGRGCLDAVVELERWALACRTGGPSRPRSGATLMTRLLATYAGGLSARVGIDVDGDCFMLASAGDAISIRRGGIGLADFLIRGEAEAIASLLNGGLSIATAKVKGSVEVSGAHALAADFVTCFPLPRTVPVG